MKSLLSILVVVILGAVPVFSQSKEQNGISSAIQAKEYVFKARTVMPASGSTRQLTSTYDFTVNGDSVISYLPYFGRAFVAPIGRTESVLDYTSTDFSYKASQGKKGGWVIEIRPKDAEDVELVSINISKTGYGTLYVNSRNRQAISFSGKVEPLKKKS